MCSFRLVRVLHESSSFFLQNVLFCFYTRGGVERYVMIGKSSALVYQNEKTFSLKECMDAQM